jgi:type I restriction enzyme S subunit
MAVTLRDLVPSGPSIGLIANLAQSKSTRYILAQGAYGFKIDESRLNPSYLVWLSNYEPFRLYMKRYAVGSTQVHIRTPIFQNLQIPLPPIDEQRRIAAILDQADAIRRKRQQAIALTDELLRSTFLEMFGDPVINPKGWEVLQLGSLIKIASGQVDPQIKPYIDMPHIGGENIQSNTGLISGVKTPRELRLKSGKYLFDEGDILYSKIRPYLNKVATPDFKGVCSADIYPLKVDESKLYKYYFIYVLRSKLFLNYAEKHSTRTNIPKINRLTFLKFELPYPPLKLQEKFSKVCSSTYSMKKNFDFVNLESNNLFNSLLQRAFKGQL